jgi:hypothetical protein
MDNVFPNATEARDGARNNSLIYAEIRAIEAVILEAIDVGLLNTNVPSGSETTTVASTVMTSTNTLGETYCAVWQGTVIDRSKFEQMMIILKYFGDLGYTIRRKLLDANSTSFVWEVLW